MAGSSDRASGRFLARCRVKWKAADRRRRRGDRPGGRLARAFRACAVRRRKRLRRRWRGSGDAPPRTKVDQAHEHDGNHQVCRRVLRQPAGLSADLDAGAARSSTRTSEDVVAFSIEDPEGDAAGGGRRPPRSRSTSPRWSPPPTPAAGEGVFRKCAACHKVDGSDGVGPHLDGVVGRDDRLGRGLQLFRRAGRPRRRLGPGRISTPSSRTPRATCPAPRWPSPACRSPRTAPT